MEYKWINASIKAKLNANKLIYTKKKETQTQFWKECLKTIFIHDTIIEYWRNCKLITNFTTKITILKYNYLYLAVKRNKLYKTIKFDIERIVEDGWNSQHKFANIK